MLCFAETRVADRDSVYIFWRLDLAAAFRVSLRRVPCSANGKLSKMIFMRDGSANPPPATARCAGADRSGSPQRPPSPPTVRSPILQGIVVLPGISGRVLNTVEIALLRDIAICEFRVSFRGTPAY